MATDMIHITKLLKCLKITDDFIHTNTIIMIISEYFNFVATAGNTVLPNIS